MDELIKKYEQPKPKAPNSPLGEQINRAVEITGKSFKQLAGLTRHLSIQQIFFLNKESKGDPRLWWWLYKQKYKLNNMTKLMVEKLEKFPEFRERKNRDIYLAKWALRDTEIDTQVDGQWKKITLLDKQREGKMFTMGELGKFGIRFASLDRDWRDTLKMHSNLRGKDYDMKDELEERELKRLGYK